MHRLYCTNPSEGLRHKILPQLISMMDGSSGLSRTGWLQYVSQKLSTLSRFRSDRWGKCVDHLGAVSLDVV